jgi:hypothetical protein
MVGRVASLLLKYVIKLRFENNLFFPMLYIRSLKQVNINFQILQFSPRRSLSDKWIPKRKVHTEQNWS